jgi:hypothetical protein
MSKGAFGAEVLMPAKLSIAFFGMIVGGVAILIAVIAVYLATAQLQYRSMARLQDRTMQAQEWEGSRYRHAEVRSSLQSCPEYQQAASGRA